MTNVKYDSIEDYNCCYTTGDYRAMIAQGISPKEAIDKLAPRSRDNARTPYQWDSSENAGFTSGKPWIKVNPKYTDINLEADRSSEDSIFDFYKKLIEMRKTNPAIVEGDLEFLLEDHESILCYLRRSPEQSLLVVANYCGNNVKFDMPHELCDGKWERLLTNKKDTVPSVLGSRELLPWEVEIYEYLK